MTGRFRMEVADSQIVWLVDDYPFDEYEVTWGMVVEWVQADIRTTSARCSSGAPQAPGSLLSRSISGASTARRSRSHCPARSALSEGWRS